MRIKDGKREYTPDPNAQPYTRRNFVQYEQKDMEGAAFQKEKTEDWHADWSGKAMVDGTMYWLNIYDNISKAGAPYKKVRFKPMENNGAPPPPAFVSAIPTPEKEGDDIPF